MAARPTTKLSPAQLRKAFKQDLAAAWSTAQRQHPHDTPYAFVLYGVEGGEPRLWPCVLTEESLSAVARRYVDEGYHDTLDEARAALRYSIGDSPRSKELEGTTPTVDALVAPHAASLGEDEEAGYAILAKAAIAALRDLDAEGPFGTGADRERLLLLVITEDLPKDWSTESARKLNPPAAFNRFETETKVEGTYAASSAMVLSADGRSLYSAGSRENPAGRPGSAEEFLGCLVAYDLEGSQLRRRWAFEFTGFGDSIGAIACAPDGRWVAALRTTYRGGTPSSTLLRFSRDSNVPEAQRMLPAGAKGLAASRDGSRLAVVLDDATLHRFDADLRPLSEHALADDVHQPAFLRNGDLLLPGDRGVYHLPLASAAPPRLVSPLRAFGLATDADDHLLAVSRWLPLERAEREQPAEFGVHLLALPTFEPLHTVLVPGHQAVTPALSPDGRWLAFEAHEIGKPRKFVGVFDTATGREVARRKSNFVRGLAFLPDSRRLAIAGSAITTGEPIEFWRVPET